MKTIIKQTLKKIRYPGFSRTLYELRMIENMRFGGKKVSFTLKLPFKDIPIEEILIQDIKNALNDKVSNISVDVNLEEMDMKQQNKFVKMLQRTRRK